MDKTAAQNKVWKEKEYFSPYKKTEPTLCLKKVPTFKLSQLCQILTNFQNFCTAGKRTKFAIKPMRQCPPHLRHVVTLPWEIKNSNFLQIFSRHCKNANILHFTHL